MPTVVLVHGAFADAMAWARVIPLLERAATPSSPSRTR
jgi:pimeloyl-ACP methyl ester carboxylesterase